MSVRAKWTLVSSDCPQDFLATAGSLAGRDPAQHHHQLLPPAHVQCGCSLWSGRERHRFLLQRCPTDPSKKALAGYHTPPVWKPSPHSVSPEWLLFLRLGMNTALLCCNNNRNDSDYQLFSEPSHWVQQSTVLGDHGQRARNLVPAHPSQSDME
jgi:hypothetical protein